MAIFHLSVKIISRSKGQSATTSAVYHFLKRLLKAYDRTSCLATDRYEATLKAIKQVAKDGLIDLKAHQCSKYRNNLIEQDHRFIKRHRVQ